MRKGAKAADHEEQLRAVFGEENTAKLLKDDLFIGKLSRTMFDEEKENGHGAGANLGLEFYHGLYLKYATILFHF